MTREEAIEYLKRADITVGQTIKTRTAEALEMAINALQTEHCEDRKNCPHRHENGNCLSVGGFCLAVDNKHCQLKNEPCGKDTNVPATDAISRQAAIEQSIVLRDISNPDKEWEVVTVATIKHLKSVQTEQRWIPVSERLPNNHEYIKNNGLFNVSDGNRSYSEWFDIYDTQMFGEPTMNGFRVDRCVTAWQPLPETFKAESEDKE